MQVSKQEWLTDEEGQGNRRRSRTKWISAMLLTLVLGVVPSGLANASGLLVAKGGFGGRLLIKEQIVNVTINNGIAVTEVNQIFLNTESRIVEALYTFPVPVNASVSNFSMIINGKEMIGEVVEKKRARQIYQSYKRTKKDPGLLEQVDYKTFEMRVFPIQPHAEQHIKVVYYQPLDVDHDWSTYVFPLATSTKAENEKTSGKFALTLDIKSEIPVKKITSHSHPNEFVVVNHSSDYARASMEVNEGDLSRDIVIAFQSKRAKTGIDLITSKHAGEDGYFLMSLTAGEELENTAGGMDYVFVVDISGSMRNDGKLMLSQGAVEAFVNSLGEEDRFDVMVFNNAPKMLFSKLAEVNVEAKKKLTEFLGEQYAKGGTDLRPAMNAAYRYKQPDRELNVVVLSDGMTEAGGQKELLGLIADAPSSSKVFCVGIGNEVNRPLLKQLAEDAGGLATFISHEDDFIRQADAFRRKLVHPVATDLVLSIDGVPVYDTLPGALPNLYHGKPIRMIGRYKDFGQGDITLKGTVMGRPFEQSVSFDFPKLDADNPQIDRMWAWYRVQGLMDEMRKNGDSPDLVNEIVNLCEGYSIVSEYASFIVLENDKEYKRWKIDRRNATRIQRDRAARNKLDESLKQLRENSMANLGPIESDSKSKEVAKTATKPTAPKKRVANNAPQRGQDLNFGTQPVSTRPNPPKRSSSSSKTPAKSNSSPWRSTSNRSSGGGGGGGGAIDPITGLIAAGMAGVAAARRKRKGVAKKDAEAS
ncbi:MAG: VIT domain-containing protein [Mariniblastus sp.]|nr:VIT domain-containing protein [Mariniblastus sp.]